MIILHDQTETPDYAEKALTVARYTALPDIYKYTFANGSFVTYNVTELGQIVEELAPYEILNITIQELTGGNATVGLFNIREIVVGDALVSLATTFFILFVWFFGITAFAGPVMILVVIPIERMVRLLGMLMVDPLGFETTSRYKKFVAEEKNITTNTQWTDQLLQGMETSFLMSTIIRIGSLMKVGFGSAGVEIIRNNLAKQAEAQNKQNQSSSLALNSEGTTVHCIFLFCDIRQFTDATECLQEEVFVFTNKVASVVHSICAAYHGSANKNIGDAFLMSWLLDELPDKGPGGGFGAGFGGGGFGGGGGFEDEEDEGPHNPVKAEAKKHQADKAMFSVVKIIFALQYDDFYIKEMSSRARDALLTKLANRSGPVVQMGCGLHAGEAVQGAIGSVRKIDATYISEHVDLTEFLESSTKAYGVKMLLSDSFYSFLHPTNKRRCRKVDQVMIVDAMDDDADEEEITGTRLDLYTFDMDVEALFNPKEDKKKTGSTQGSDSGVNEPKRTPSRKGANLRRPSSRRKIGGAVAVEGAASHDFEQEEIGPPKELILPTGVAIYNAHVWMTDDMLKIRERYKDGYFFPQFATGLQAFYSRNWPRAKQCFSGILDRFEDGPSRYFMNQIEEHGGKAPRNFKSYGIA
jgi:class 3 adenylate cyclase